MAEAVTFLVTAPGPRQPGRERPGWTIAEAVAAISPTLAGVRRLGVAFSGGVDSSVLLALAARMLGATGGRAARRLAEPRCLGAYGRAPGRRRDRASVGRDCDQRGRSGGLPREWTRPLLPLQGRTVQPIDDGVASAYGLDAIAYGENADDARRPDRPGAQAATQHAVLRPLADAGMTKADVRTIARALGLTVADKPAAPCLASRIPHHSR